jgi:hypothetical protein
MAGRTLTELEEEQAENSRNLKKDRQNTHGT